MRALRSKRRTAHLEVPVGHRSQVVFDVFWKALHHAVVTMIRSPSLMSTMDSRPSCRIASMTRGLRRGSRRSIGTMRGSLALACTVLLAGCTTSGPPHPSRPSSIDDVSPFVRACDTAVFGDPNMKNAITIGPLVLVGIPQAANLPSRAFKPREGRYGAIKVLAVVEGSTDVTVTVPGSQRDSVSLLYDPGARANRNGFLLSAGDPSVTFEACPGKEPQYNGGFIATGPSCVNLEVQSQASPTWGWISLGAGRSCPN
jgi:hypothetical protein